MLLNSYREMAHRYFRNSRHFTALTYITYKTYKSRKGIETRLFRVLDFTINEWHNY